MQGRIEHELKIENNIQNILLEMPVYVSDYYYAISSGTTPKTCETYLKQIRGFLKFINSNTKIVSAENITETVVGRYMKTIQKKEINGVIVPTSFSYQKTIWSSLNGLFCYLKKRKIIVENPIENIRRPVYQDNVKRIELNKEDLQDILHSVEKGVGNNLAIKKQKKWIERDKSIISLFISTGMRCSALSEIDIEDLNFEDNMLTIIDKRRIKHVYYISEGLKERLLLWISKRNDIMGTTSGALFISSFRQRLCPKEIYNLVKKYSKEALGYSISPHKLRAAFCTLLYNETHDIEFVRDAVGHKNINTTLRYVVKNDSVKKTASDIMSKLI